MKWEVVEFNDVLEKIVGGGTPSKNIADYWNGDIHWCSVKDMVGDRYQLYSTEDTITISGLENSSANLVLAGTVITSTRMGLGRAFINKVDMAINQDLKALIPNEKIDNSFLLWTIVNKKGEIEGLGIGSTVKGIRLEVLRGLKFILPPLPTQRRIASILSAYDDLIENNLKRIKLLEEAINITYKSFMSVDDKKFTNVKLNSFVEIISGYPFKSNYYNEKGKHKIVTIKNVQDGFFVPEVTDRIEDVPDKINVALFLSTGDVIMSLTGNVGRVCLVYGDDYVLNQRVVKLSSKERIDQSFIYALVRDKQMLTILENLSNGTAQQNLSPIKMGELAIRYPNSNLRENFDKKASPMIEMICKLNMQNTKLREARDILLPRLMSGEVEV